MSTPNIPTLGAKVDPDVRRAIEALKRYFDGMKGRGGIVSQEALTQAISDSESGSLITPPRASGLSATGAFNKVILTWDAPTYAGHAYTNLYRAEVDDFGVAVQVSSWPGTIAADTPPDSSLGKTYYYWIRYVSTSSTEGAINATAGTAGSTADDPEYLLEIASEKWQPSYDYAVGDLVFPTKPNGYIYEVTVDGGSSGASEPVWPTVINDTVADGGLTWKCEAAFSFETFFKLALVDGSPKLTLKELYLADGIIKRAMIADLAVDDAKIDNLSVSKLLAGVITAANIFLGASSRIHLDGANERIVVNDGTRDRVHLGNLGASWGLKIWNASGNVILDANEMDGTYIKDATVDTLKIGPDAVTVPTYLRRDTNYTLTLDPDTSGDTGWQTIFSASFDSEQYPTLLVLDWGVITLNSGDPTLAESGETHRFEVQLLLDGTPVQTFFKEVNCYQSGSDPITYDHQTVASGNSLRHMHHYGPLVSSNSIEFRARIYFLTSSYYNSTDKSLTITAPLQAAALTTKR